MVTGLSALGLTWADLRTPVGLLKLDAHFLTYLEKAAPDLLATIAQFRHEDTVSPIALSDGLLALAPHVEAFVADFFGVRVEVERLRQSVLREQGIFTFKEKAVLRDARRALKRTGLPSFAEQDRWLSAQLTMAAKSGDREWQVAQLAETWLADLATYQAEWDQLINWCILAMTTPEGQAAVADWVSFRLPQKVDPAHLVPLAPASDLTPPRLQGAVALRERQGFQLTDPRMSERQVQNETHYCVYCHEQDGDFCGKGFPVKKADPTLGLKTNALGDVLAGCPLDEKISEMNYLKMQGFSIAPLAVVMVDNPLCPATGHRICNDCMKACIYQKQDPVNIPQIETRVLTDVLSLPYGVEIFDLLTRWNPLRRTQWCEAAYNGYKVLVMGMGPAGFTLAHYLLMEGFAVVGVDGLKIEPLASPLLTDPIASYADFCESLDDRVMLGFGGVAEYGITVRWDKNFLKLVYLTLCRRTHFQAIGGVRFGGSLRVEDAWDLGFDHVAVAVGAGLPRELRIPGSLAPGMRQANDFLMALQLTGAAKQKSLANLEIRMPVVVIGGGLTGVDAATEAQAYYIVQVEKMWHRYEQLIAVRGMEAVLSEFLPEDRERLQEFLTHGQQVAELRTRAAAKGQEPEWISFLRSLGGVTIVYRRALQDSPAYRRNHEEVIKAFEEGLYYAEHFEPEAVLLDQTGYVSGLRCRQNGETAVFPARTILVATGAKPNVAYEFEHRGTFLKEGENYRRFHSHEGELEPISGDMHVKTVIFGPFTSYDAAGRRVTFLGDTHPVFHGSVVKAVGSAKRTYPAIRALFPPNSGTAAEYAQFQHHMADYFDAVVVKHVSLGHDAAELTVRAPSVARMVHPGQFCRLQNYESDAIEVVNTVLQTEAVALLAIPGLHPHEIRFIVLNRGASSRLMMDFKPGQRVALMGPSGVRTRIPEEPETLIVMGDAMAAVYACAVAPAFRAAGHRVWFVGEKPWEVVDYLIDAVDQVFWGKVPDVQVPWHEAHRVVVLGAPDLLHTLCGWRRQMKAHFRSDVTFLAAVHGPMQCMLKGVCAQCLQWQIDPATGERTKAVYACSWQEQLMDGVDWPGLAERLGQNRVQECLTRQWLEWVLEQPAQ